MPHLSDVFAILSDLKTVVIALMVIVGALVTITKLISTVKPWVESWYSSRSIKKRLGAQLYTPGDILNATRYYIRPKAQESDPAHAKEPGSEQAVKEDLFDVVDRLLSTGSEFKYSVLLADSGMGKTSFVLSYYKRYLTRRKPFRLEVVPLGRKDADERILAIEDKAEKVLFLDALDEDVLAIVDHEQRLRDLCEMTTDFLHVLITCRTQFFPKAAEEPGRTGVLKIAATGAGKRSEYTFHKRYLSTFDDVEIDSYLRKKYSVLQLQRRRQAKALMAKIPRLTMRPMLLSYIDELLKAGRDYRYAYELYEEMVDAWLVREEGKVDGISKDSLLEFCSKLAVELVVNRQIYGGEQIALEQIGKLARDEFGIDLANWKLSGRALLNRNAEDLYKFSHRSIMEYLFVKRLVANDQRCCDVKLTDQMNAFLWEILQQYGEARQPVDFDIQGADFGHHQLVLRPEPILSLQPADVKTMLRERDFYCRRDTLSKQWSNPGGQGLEHLYVCNERQKQVVLDLRTGLTWQQSGSREGMTFKEAQAYIEELNGKVFAGYADWRLPTLEEAMSLMQPKENEYGLFIDPVFDKSQRWIWTADKYSASASWYVGFNDGDCNVDVYNHYYVRAVR